MINDPYFNVGGAVIDIFASSLNKDLVLTLLNEMFINVDEFENLSFSPWSLNHVHIFSLNWEELNVKIQEYMSK